MTKINLEPIGYISTNRKVIKDDDWGGVVSEIKLAKDLSPDTLDGIESFSHLEVIFYFDQVEDQKVVWGSAYPRGNEAYPKVGIFAQRKKSRPNKLGLTIVKLLERVGDIIKVQGLDGIDGTPILDIKPVMKEFLPREETRQPEWASDLMKGYW